MEGLGQKGYLGKIDTGNQSEHKEQEAALIMCVLGILTWKEHMAGRVEDSECRGFQRVGWGEGSGQVTEAGDTRNAGRNSLGPLQPSGVWRCPTEPSSEGDWR